MDSIAHCLRKCKTETEIRVGMRQSCFWKGKIPLSAYADIPLFKGDKRLLCPVGHLLYERRLFCKASSFRGGGKPQA